MKPNGVQIYVSWKEYEAIYSALAEIENNCEAAEDEYIESIQEDIKALNNIIRKFKNAKYRKDNK